MKPRPPQRPAHHHANPLAEESLAKALLLAASIIGEVRAGTTLTQALADFNASRSASAAQRGAVHDFCYGTLRDFGRGGFLLSRLMDRPPPEPIEDLLLVALHRLERRPEDAHTIVDQTVEAAGQLLRGNFRALTNGVLRNYLRRSEELLRAAALEPQAHHRHPSWWVDAVRAAYPQQWESVLAAGNMHPPMALRPNRRRTDAALLQQSLREAGIDTRRQPNDALLLAQPVPVTRLPGFEAGLMSVQDVAAQWVPELLDLAPGQRVLDACAAPGGKTAHILEHSDVTLTAIELDPQRARRIDENLERLGLQASLRIADCRQLDDWWDGQPFDRILADVPCSASGVVRRHPDIKWLRRADDIARFAQQQSGILDRLWHTLKPDGKMLYVTCSVFPEENALQIRHFLQRQPDARQLPLAAWPSGQCLPCAEHDGFYYALLAKRA